MKRVIIYILFTILIAAGLFLLPKMRKEAPPEDIMSTDMPISFDNSLTLQVKFPDGVREMALSEYLVGVVSAEMPDAFPIEAQKAQAIAARTFTLKNSNKHPDADICASSACCQGWSNAQNAAAIEAVRQTDGLVITYENKLIDATYFSCCEDRTEAAVSVWGSEIPYLQSVESPDVSEGYTQEVIYSQDEFARRLREYYPDLSLEGDWLGKIAYTKGGGIDTAVLGGTEISGTTLRAIFCLRSTDIDIALTEQGVLLTTHGFGHRVGMSQHGAKAMAEGGKTFNEILSHYYQNIILQRLYTKKTPSSETEEALFSQSLLCHGDDHGSKQGQQNECAGNPLGNASKLRFLGCSLVLAEIVAGITCHCTEIVLFAALQHNDNDQGNRRNDLHDQKSNIHHNLRKITALTASGTPK